MARRGVERRGEMNFSGDILACSGIKLDCRLHGAFPSHIYITVGHCAASSLCQQSLQFAVSARPKQVRCW
jgi:hypothetical protein